MSNELVKTENIIAALDKEQVELIKKLIAPDATDPELQLFIFDCQRRGVHPLDKKIFFVKRDGKAVHQASIDFFRSSAEESGEYNGQDEPEFEGVTADGFPELCRVRIWRKGIDRPFVGVARWNEFYPGEKLGFMWRKMPHNQLSKCAEANGFRKAFPSKFSKLYVPEEIIDLGEPAKTSSKPKVEQPREKSLEIKEAIFGVKTITQRTGKKTNGTEYTKFTITADDGMVYGTFSSTDAETAKIGKNSNLKIKVKYKESQYGKTIEDKGVDVTDEETIEAFAAETGAA